MRVLTHMCKRSMQNMKCSLEYWGLMDVTARGGGGGLGGVEVGEGGRGGGGWVGVKRWGNGSRMAPEERASCVLQLHHHAPGSLVPGGAGDGKQEPETSKGLWGRRGGWKPRS